MQVCKRDGETVVKWDINKIKKAIKKAHEATNIEYDEELLNALSKIVELKVKELEKDIVNIETVQDIVEENLILIGQWRVARAYVVHRERRAAVRENKDQLMDTIAEIDQETTRDNANVGNSMAGKALQISEAASSYFYLNRVVSERFARAHESGDFYIHDRAWIGKGANCIQAPIDRLMTKGFNTGHGYIRPPRSLKTAAMHVAIILQANQNEMYGGQSVPDFDNQFISTGIMNIQREKIKRDMQTGLSLANKRLEDIDSERLEEIVEQRLEHKGYQAMEALIYNLNSMHSRGGSQVAFTSLNIGNVKSKDAAKICEWLLKAYEAGLGNSEQPIFPNICYKIKAGVNKEPDDPYYYLTKLAFRVASRRLNPSFVFMDSSFNKDFDDVAYMGCRTRVISNRHGESIVTGRGNIAFATINLPRLGLKTSDRINIDSRKEAFWPNLDQAIGMVIEHLVERFNYLATHLKKKDFPFLMGQGLYMDSENLSPQDSIYKAIRHGTLSIGFIGLAECLKAILGYHHGESEAAQELGEAIVAKIRERADRACERYDLNFSVIATPAEGLSGRFPELDRKKFGNHQGVNDKEYYTNSYHIPVDFPISSFNKIRLEGVYHKYCNGGHISYIEFGSMPPLDNTNAVEAIVRCMADSDMGYAAINYPIDRCNSCGWDKDVIEKDMPCPNCKEVENISRIRRITGYLSVLSRFNDAKQIEEHDRIAQYS